MSSRTIPRVGVRMHTALAHLVLLVACFGLDGRAALGFRGNLEVAPAPGHLRPRDDGRQRRGLAHDVGDGHVDRDGLGLGRRRHLLPRRRRRLAYRHRRPRENERQARRQRRRAHRRLLLRRRSRERGAAQGLLRSHRPDPGPAHRFPGGRQSVEQLRSVSALLGGQGGVGHRDARRARARGPQRRPALRPRRRRPHAQRRGHQRGWAGGFR